MGDAKKRKLNTREVVFASLFAAATVALGLVMIPVQPVPVTGQSMGPMLAGSIAGPKIGALSLIAFDLLAAAGVPVLSGGRGGLGIILGPTGGYVLSWPIAAYVIGRLLGHSKEPSFLRLAAANAVGGIIVVYAVGVPWLALVQGIGIKTALLEGALLFLPGDILKVAAVSIAARAVHRADPGWFSQT